ncbi:hypothetical protein [uncultured Rhodoblastus sp.]|uniref:hypothetical protein n=1 Tax=uncultured Rhodoblastus sp. TaxID=543037 RepID=UPI0025CC3379|nr:hypothetical protein [uncultured Rhodoblastus sp.]
MAILRKTTDEVSLPAGAYLLFRQKFCRDFSLIQTSPLAPRDGHGAPQPQKKIDATAVSRIVMAFRSARPVIEPYLNE